MTSDERDEQFYRDTESVAHAKLDDGQLAMLEPLGSRRKVPRGELIFKTGQRDVPLVVILHGEVEVFEARDEQEQILGTADERDFIGERHWQAREAKRMKARFWKCPPQGCDRRSQNCRV